MQYMNFYRSIKNPLNDNSVLDKIIAAYADSSSMYRGLTRTNSNKVTGRYVPQNENEFYVTIFNCWKKSLQYIDRNGKVNSSYREACAKAVRYLNTVNPSSKKEVLNILNGSNIADNEVRDFINLTRWTRCGEDTGWNHIDSSYVFNNTHTRQEIEHRLYINCDSTLTHKIITEFAKKCLDAKSSFYFKFDDYGARDDNIVVYCDSNHLEMFTKFFNQIVNENPDIRKGIHTPPILTGCVDGFIGYGTEPGYFNGKLISFNDKRAQQLEDCLRDLTGRYVASSLNKSVAIGSNKSVPYYSYLIDSLVQNKIDELTKDIERVKGKRSAKDIWGYELRDIQSAAFRENLRNAVYTHYADFVSSIKMGKRIDAIRVPVGTGNASITNYDIAKLVKKQAKLMGSIPQFKRDLVDSIKRTCPKYGIDPNNYSFDTQQVEKFRKLDASRVDQYDDTMKFTGTKGTQGQAQYQQPKRPQGQAQYQQPRGNTSSNSDSNYTYTAMSDEEIEEARRKVSSAYDTKSDHTTRTSNNTQNNTTNRTNYTGNSYTHQSYGPYRAMSDDEIEAARRKINGQYSSSTTHQTYSDRPKTKSGYIYRPMTDAEIRKSQEKLGVK